MTQLLLGDVPDNNAARLGADRWAVRHGDCLWGEHVIVGKRFGLTSEDIARVIEGPDAAGLDEHGSAVLRAVDELHGDAMISDATWHTLAKRLDARQLIELPIIVGQYQTVAYYQNSLRLRLHAGNIGLKAR